MEEELHLPSASSFDRQSLWHWYQNIEKEIQELELSSAERAAMSGYYREAGLLTWHKRSFFRRHFVDTFAAAAAFLFESRSRPVLLDLGSGMGTQALFLALAGAKVHAVDMDDLALGVLEKRRTMYEGLIGRALDIDIHCGSAHEIDYASLGGIDGVYSMFAFNMMQPSDDLVDRIAEGCSPGARIAIIDGNSVGWLPRLLPARRRDVWSPEQFERELSNRRFRVREHTGGICIPPIVWALVPYSMVEALDTHLNGNWFLPISHQILAELR